MKKLLFYIIALPCLILAVYGCQKEEEVPDGGGSSSDKSVISVRKPSAYSFLPGTYSLPYTIDNPREGVQLELSTTDKWITGLTADKENISFTLSASNPSEERQGSISICYEGADPVSVEIRQKKEDIVPLDKDGITANCYIVPEAGVYQFPMVKGNSPEPVGDVVSVGVLWETFGTDAVPEQGDLIQIVLHEDNMVYFKSAGRRDHPLELAYLDDGQAAGPGVSERCRHNDGPRPRCDLSHSGNRGILRPAVPVGKEGSFPRVIVP